MDPGGWLIVATVIALVVALAVAGYIGAGVADAWTRVQRTTWEVLHGLDDAVAAVAEPYKAELRGLVAGCPTTIRLAATFVVVDREGATTRSNGVRVEIEVQTAIEGEVMIKAVAPVDDEDDEWEVPGRVCDALGEPFHSDREPPATLTARLELCHTILHRLARYNLASDRGWRRVGIELANGSLRISGIAFGGVAVDALELATALVRPLPASYRSEPVAELSSAPPLPEPPPHGTGQRVLAMLGAFSFGYVFVIVMIALPLIIAMSTVEYRASAIDGRVLALEEPIDSESSTYHLVFEHDGATDKLSVSNDVVDLVGAHCLKGSSIHKRAWDPAFTCTAPLAELEAAPPSGVRIEQDRSWTAAIVLGTLALLALGVTMYTYYRTTRGSRHPTRLPWPPADREAVLSVHRGPDERGRTGDR